MATIITAHSGAENTPENSLEFIKSALALECAAFEVDITYINGEYCLTHDLPKTNAGLVRLAECFALLRDASGKLLNCDMKTGNAAAGVLALAAEYGVTDRLIFTGDVTESDAHAIESAGAQWWMNIFARPEGVAPEDAISELKARNSGWVNIDKAALTPELFAALHENGIKISVWTVSTENEVAHMLASGVDNITSRLPVMAQNVMKAKHGN